MNNLPSHYDVVCFGETMLRFTPPHWQRIEQSPSLEMHVGGSESNTAVGLARLGNSVAWFSRMTSNPLGRMVCGELSKHGVDTRHVVWTENDRVGLYFLEPGALPRASQVIYDRAGSAASLMQSGDLPDSLFSESQFRVFHSTGITAAISLRSRETLGEAYRRAKRREALLSFDLNFRAKLWTLDEARLECEELCRMVDILFLPKRDAIGWLKCGSDIGNRQILEGLSRLYPQAILIMTLGKEGAAGWQSGGFCESPAFPAVAVDRLGGGDAFSAGFLHGWLKTNHLESSLRYGNATAALKYSIAGDLPLVTSQEVEQLLQGDPISGIQR